MLICGSSELELLYQDFFNDKKVDIFKKFNLLIIDQNQNRCEIFDILIGNNGSFIRNDLIFIIWSLY